MGIFLNSYRRNPYGTLDALRFSMLTKIGRILMPRYKFTWPQLDWWDDVWFQEYLAAFGEVHGMNSGRRWTLWQLLRMASGVPGDTAECGVFEGAGSYLICEANRRDPAKWHFAFDSFEGLSAPSEVDGKFWKKGDLSRTEDVVRANLANFNRVSLHPGWIPERFQDVEERKFSFVHIDVDVYQPTLASMEFFYPRLADGGMIVCDDYGFSTCPGATRAVDEFLADKPEKMIFLPYGSGLLVKGLATANVIPTPVRRTMPKA